MSFADLSAESSNKSIATVVEFVPASDATVELGTVAVTTSVGDVGPVPARDIPIATNNIGKIAATVLPRRIRQNYQRPRPVAILGSRRRP